MKPKQRSRIIELLMDLTDQEAFEVLTHIFQRIDDNKTREELLKKFPEVEHGTKTQ